VNALLWLLAAPLALVFLTAASVRALAYDLARRQMAWVGAVPRPLLLFVSVAEILGALGLVLPGLTHASTLLIPLAAAGLGLIQFLAIFFHISRHEPRNATANVALLCILAFIAVGRLALSPI
jgi:hypothetical protein